jgi:transcriptional regulator with XRE-family HTH domain
MENTSPTFDPSKLRKAREDKGLTQEQAAALVGVYGKRMISKYECGYRQPRADILMRICRAYGINAESLFE